MSQRELRGSAIKKLPSGRYQIDFRDQFGVRHRESFDREKDARAALDKKRTEIRQGEYIPPKTVPTFREMAEVWLEGKRTNAGKSGKPVKETSLIHWQNHLDRYLVPALGRYPLDKITTGLLEEMRFKWKDNGERRLSPASVNKLLTTTAAIFDEAIRLGKVKHNPASKARRLGIGSVEAQGNGEKENGEVRPEQVYNPEELKRLIDAAEPGLYRAVIMTIVLTGIRHGEALALQWGDIDFEAGKFTIRRSWPDIYDKNGEPVFYLPKTKSALREVPIPEELVSALKKWKLQSPVSKWDLVFPKEDGRPEDRKTILRGLYRAIRRAGLKRLDMHALRHTYASILLSQGAPITEVSCYLGHANPQITLSIYSHWLPRTKTDSVARLAGAILGGEKPFSDQVGHLKDTLELSYEAMEEKGVVSV